MTVDAQSVPKDPNQMLLYNELYSKYVQPQQQQQQQPQQPQQQPQQQPYQQPQQQPYNSYNNFADFQLFMQFMMYYEQLYGKDYIIKLYADDDDDDDDDKTVKHIHKHFTQYKKDRGYDNNDKPSNYRPVEPNNKKETPQQVCKDNSGEWKDGTCNFSKDEKAKGDDDGFNHSMEEAGLWDGYALDQRDKKLENICNKVDGKWAKGVGCDTGGGDTPKADRFNELVDKTPGTVIIDPQSGGVVPVQTLPPPKEDKEKLVVPSLLEGTLTKEQKEALSKENPDWEFKPGAYIPNSLEGKLTQEQMGALSEDNSDIEYQWEDTDSNPVPGTPSYVEPDEVEEDSPPPVIEDGSNIVTPISDEPREEPPSDDKEWTKSPTTFEYKDEEEQEQHEEEFNESQQEEEVEQEESGEEEQQEPEEEEEEESDDEEESEEEDSSEESDSEE
jgi:hypothetical protein